MELDLSALAERLDGVVRAVPGVRVLYSSAPAVVAAVRQIGAVAENTTLVSVRAAEGELDIVANIGVASSVQGPRTAAAVSAALLASVPTGMAANVHVRISRVLD